MEKNALSKDYFATLTTPEELAEAIKDKITLWRKWSKNSGVYYVQEKKFSNYYGISQDGNSSQMVVPGGAEGELSLIKVNDLGTLLGQQLVTVTSQRPTGMAKATNSDSASLKSAKIGTAVAEFYMSEGGFEMKFVKGAEIALLLDECFVENYWDKDAGDPIGLDPHTGEIEMSGDGLIKNHCSWNVARDTGANCEEQAWFILSYKENKFDLAARYPRFSEEILDLKNDSTEDEFNLNKIPDGSDYIYVHKLIHDRTSAVPNGRYSLLVGDKIVLDTELPFKDFPVERMTAQEVIEGITGYSRANDLMALEQSTDALHSATITNNITFGGQSIVIPDGLGIKVSDMGKGLRVFEAPPDMVDKIIPLQLTKTAPETYTLISNLTAKKHEMVGNVNAVIGQQAVQGASGSAMALVQAQAIQFNSGIQRNYYGVMSKVMTKFIAMMAKYADTPRVARIVGKSKSQGLKEFKYTGQDLSSVSSIVYEITNAMSQSIGGKLAMAQDLIKAGQITSPKQYITVATTGSLEAMTQNDENAELLIIEENEEMTEGRPVQAIITEHHADHIKSHMDVLASVKAKQDPAMVQMVLAHIQEHTDLWTQASQSNPGILMASGQQPLMPPQPPPGMMPPGLPPPTGGDKVMGNGASPAQHKAEEVRQPNLPINPLTHERVSMPQGGPQ